jgi:hypothetical protein
MIRHLDGLKIRRRLGRDVWGIPIEFGPDGWRFDAKDGSGRIIVTCWDHDDGLAWVHASISRLQGVPPYEDLKLVHHAVWGDGYAYQVFVPPSEHVNIHERALHLWGRLDGEPAFPPFNWGTI